MAGAIDATLERDVGRRGDTQAFDDKTAVELCGGQDRGGRVRSIFVKPRE